MQIPILSRLGWEDYKRLLLAISILIGECTLRLAVWVLPVSLMDFVRYRIVRFVPRIFTGYHDEDIDGIRDPLAAAETTKELIDFHGYGCEEHLVITADGYILLVHRILPQCERSRVSTASSDSATSTNTFHRSTVPSITTESSSGGPPVLFIHGAMLTSELWLCQRDTTSNLALKLVDEGYDVWLANRRGTKYSQKHVFYRCGELKFWDYSLDETIMHDVPAVVEHILGNTGYRSISLVGFSQGTAETFGALALSRRLHNRVNCAIGLSATAKPPTPKNSLILSMVHWSPELVFLLFGRRSMLSSVLFWQQLLSPRALVWGMDMAMFLLFGWSNANIRQRDKLTMYKHFFALASVKQIVHWFQIMKAGRFQMFDDTPSKSHIVPEYPLKNIRIPTLIFLGTKDCLIDESFVADHLPAATVHHIHGYEHMDTVWAKDAPKQVHPRIIEFLRIHARRVHHLALKGTPMITEWPVVNNKV